MPLCCRAAMGIIERSVKSLVSANKKPVKMPQALESIMFSGVGKKLSDRLDWHI